MWKILLYNQIDSERDFDQYYHWLPPKDGWKGMLKFTKEDLSARYAELAPRGQVDLVVIGCPQASIEEIRRTASIRRTFNVCFSEAPISDSNMNKYT